jgi:hypothetical protein
VKLSIFEYIWLTTDVRGIPSHRIIKIEESIRAKPIFTRIAIKPKKASKRKASGFTSKHP